MITDLVIDAENILMRALRVCETRGVDLSFTDADGRQIPTAALLLFVNMLSRHIRELAPERLVLCWDGGADHRRALFPGYKANRAERPEDEQEVRDSTYDLARTFADLAGLKSVRLPGVEADDVIAEFWRSRRPDARFAILSGDRDFHQLLDPAPLTVMISPDQGLICREHVVTKWGCEPAHLPAVRALIGDSSDGIPGVRRCGPKTAVKWLASVDFDLERLLANPPSLLCGQQALVRRNLALMDLRHSTILPQMHAGILPPFAPVASEGLLALISRTGMASIQARLRSGTLWSDRPAASATAWPMG